MDIRPFCPDDEQAVIRLWEECGLTRPWNDPHQDIQRKLRVRPDLFLVGEIEGRIAGTVMAGYEGHRGWINYLAVSPVQQKKGYGRLLMDAAEARLREAGCPKINLQVRSANTGVIDFYRRLGYTVDDVVSMGKRLEHDVPQAQATLDARLREHHAVIESFLAQAGALTRTQWTAPRAPGKWSPAQEAAHLALVYAAFATTLRGGPPRALCVPAARADELQRTVLPAILEGRDFPTGARAPQEATPPDEPGEPALVLPRLREASEAFAAALGAAWAATPGTRAVHPYFGPLALPNLVGLLTAHARHHLRFLPAAA